MQRTVPIKNRGFTLIELLLVLALVVALTVAGIAAYQVQLRNFKVDKTALQMQQWLQAGLAFRADCGQWPRAGGIDNPTMLDMMTGKTALDKPTCDKYATQNRAYMLPGSEYGPWPATFMHTFLPGNSYSIQPSTTDRLTAPRFEVYTILEPATKDMERGTEAAAKMIAGRLPNAIVERVSNGWLVRAYVGKGGVSGAGPVPPNGGAQILNMEMVDNRWGSGRIKKPEDGVCPAGTMPVLVSAISSIDAGWLKTPHGGVAVAGVSKGTLVNQGSILDKDGGGYIDWNKIPLNKDNNVERNNTIKDNFFEVAVDQPAAEVDKPRNDAQAVNKTLFISACVPDPKAADKKTKTTGTQTTTSSPGISRY